MGWVEVDIPHFYQRVFLTVM